jgi:predicted regulator of Ras-like GTPase activity (Roadblock/LC7/MglB family)
MASLPQLIEEDVARLDEELRGLLAQTETACALIIDQGGFLIASGGDTEQFDATSLAALAAGAFMASQTIATLVHEKGFSSVYQQGEVFSLFIVTIDADSLLVVIFSARISVGLVKYFALPAAERMARHLRVARERNPGVGFDLSALNLADARPLFRRVDPS